MSLRRSTARQMAVVVLICLVITPARAQTRTPPTLPTDVIVATSLTGGLAAGALASAFDVSSIGEAIYQMPLWTPAAKGAAQVPLALAYRDGAPDGILGAGWSLKGPSSISRCAKTFALDGLNRAVMFDANDLFCLDGQRLQLVSSGIAYGADGAEYRTVPDTFVKITSHQPDAKGPQYFLAYLPNGQIVTYGGDASTRKSRLEGPRYEGKPALHNSAVTTFQSIGDVRLTWAVSQVEDRAGNAHAYFYDLGGQLGTTQLLTEIRYTFNTKHGSVVDAKRKVAFQYESRPDSVKRYLSGFRSAFEKRLKTVSMSGPDASGQMALLREYKITYDSSAPFTQVASVGECDGAGACLPPTSFEWSPRHALRATNGPGGSGFEAVRPGDFNGDGCDDLLYFRPAASTVVRGWYVAEQKNCGTNLLPDYSSERFLWNSAEDSLRVIDINADGADDIVVIENQPFGSSYVRGIVDVVLGGSVKKGTSSCAPLACRATNLFTAIWDPSLFGLEPAVWFADLSGDGLSDFVFAVRVSGIGVLQYKRNFGAKVDPMTGSVDPLVLSAAQPLDSLGDGSALAGDINNDNAVDMLYAQYTAASWTWTGATSFPDGSISRRPSGMRNGYVFQAQQWLADLNGDGLIDLVEAPESGGDLSIAYNSGNGFEASTTLSGWTMPANRVSGTYLDNAVRFADIDYDGVNEILQMTGPGGRAAGIAMSARSVANGQLVSVWFAPVGVVGIVSGDQTYLGYSSSTVLDANGDGLSDLVQSEGGALRLYVSDGIPRHLLTAVSNGLGERIAVDRAPISDKSVVERSGCSPQGTAVCLTRNRSVVREVRRTSPIPGQDAVTKFSYDTPVFHVPARRFVAFRGRTLELPAGSGRITETYDLSAVSGYFPFASRPSTITRTVRLTPQHYWRSIVTNSDRVHPNADPQWVERTSADYREYEYDPATPSSPGAADLIRQTTTLWTQYDDYGNALQSSMTTNDGWSSSSTVVVPISAGNWFIRNPTSVTRVSTAPAGKSGTRLTELGYTDGLLTSLTMEPNGDCDTYLKRRYERNSDGLLWRITHEGGPACGLTPRVLTIDYDPVEGLWPLRVVDPQGHETSYAYHAGLGVLGVLADVNAVQTRRQYDGFGRLRSVDPAGGQAVSVEYARTAAGLEVTRTPSGEAPIVDAYNTLGLTVSSKTEAFDGHDISARLEYDVLGRPTKRVGPQYDGWAEHSSGVSYDALGRPDRLTHADGNAIAFSFTKGETTRTDERGAETVTVYDALGNPKSVVEEVVGSGGNRKVTTTYRYGPFSEVEAVIDGLNVERKIERDRRGRVLEMSDPYSGSASVRWTPFDDVRLYKGSKFEVSYEHDRLGRVTKRKRTTGTDEFVWDTAASGIGSLDYAESSDGVRQTLTYDTYGRPASTTWRLAAEDFRLGYSYDFMGRLDELRYPPIPGLGTPSISMVYRGPHLSEVKDNLSGLQWSADDYDPLSRLVAEHIDAIATTRRFDNRGRLRFVKSTQGLVTLQNLAIEFDRSGNVSSRHDNLARVTEDFGYDSLGRLATWTVYQRCQKFVTDFGYDDLGNLLSRHPRAPSRDCAVDFTVPGGGSYNPDSANFNAAGPTPVSHDGSGRLQSESGVSFTHDELDRITSASGPARRQTYLYDVARNFVVREVRGNREINVAGLFRRNTTLSGTQYEYFVPAGGRKVAKVTAVGGRPAITYLLRDAGGSVDVAVGPRGVVEVKKYEPFGARRYPHSIATDATPALSGVREGYVGGYEDELGLVDLGGRVYLPSMHRFTSADPLVTEPGSSQAWNRSSYAGNNPVSYHDASGFCREPTARYETVVCAKRDPAAIPPGLMMAASGTVASPPQPPTSAKAAQTAPQGAYATDLPEYEEPPEPPTPFDRDLGAVLATAHALVEGLSIYYETAFWVTLPAQAVALFPGAWGEAGISVLEMSELEAASARMAANSPREKLIAELAASGVKHTASEILTVGRFMGQPMFLEVGNANAGLTHIMRHAVEFTGKGVDAAEIPGVVMRAVTNGRLVGFQGSGSGRPILEIVHNGQPLRIAVTVGDNGFIVGANPVSIW